VVNLYARGTRLRYLDVEMNILTFHNDQKELIKANEYIIKDILIEIGSQLGPDELETLSGKILLENKLKKQINTKLGQPVVKQIYFSGFIVQ
jgi:flagellar FliL protein